MADDRYRYRSRHSAGTWFCAAYQYDHEQEGCGILPVRILVKRIYGNIYGWYCMLLSCYSGNLTDREGFCTESTSITGRNG